MNGLIRQSYNQKLRRLSWFSKKINPLLFVPQQEGGPLFKIPLIETVSGVQVLKEIVIPIDQQKAITKDNVAVGLDGVLYIKINDPYKTTYGVVDAKEAVTAIAQTAMRSEIGKLSLDGIFSERDGLNTKIVNAINEASME